MGTTIDRLDIEIQTRSQAASNNISRLVSDLQALKSAVSGSPEQLSRIASSLVRLRDASKGFTSSGSRNIDKLAESLTKLNNVKVTGANEQMSAISGTVDVFKTLGDTLSPVKSFGKAITSFNSAIKRIGKMDIGTLAAGSQRLANALAPLTNEMLRAGPAANAYATALNEVTKSARVVSQATKTAATSNFNKLFDFGKLSLAYAALSRIADVLGRAINKINSYIENVNLFTVAMGDATDEAAEFTQKMQDLLGIDAGEAMRNMGLFNNLVLSFGVANDQAYTLSKNLTQLGYDFSSFFNITVSDAFEKLQSGIAGEIEPLTLAA